MYFKDVWYIVWPLGNFAMIWYFHPILFYCKRKKSGNPVSEGSFFYRRLGANFAPTEKFAPS
jgi:hypothetical protein